MNPNNEFNNKPLWTHNKIQMHQANPVLPDSKAANSKIERVRGANVSGASVKNKVAVNRAVVSKADDKTGSLNQIAVGGNSRRFLRPNALLKAKPLCYARRRNN